MKATSTKTNQNARTAANLHTNIGTVMNTMIKHLSLSLTALVCATGVTAALADKIDASKVTTFAAGAPARAAEVNSTIAELTSAIDDNDQRIAQLLATPAAPPAITLNVDCSADPAALSSAINGASRETALTINASGSCSAINISRDFVKIDGGTSGVTIRSDSQDVPPISVNEAQSVELKNLSLDGTGTARTALSVSANSTVKAIDLSISGATEVAIAASLQSLLLLQGENTISAGPAIGIHMNMAGLVFVESGTTVIDSDDCTISAYTSSRFFSSGIVRANGSCLFVDAESSVAISQGVVNTETVTVASGTLAIGSFNFSEGLVNQSIDPTSMVLNYSGDIFIWTGGSFWVTARNGSNTTLMAANESARVVIVGNSNAVFATLLEGNGSTVTASGDMLVIDSYLSVSAGGEGVDNRVNLGTSEDFLYGRQSYMSASGGSDNNRFSDLQFGSASIQGASYMAIFDGVLLAPETILSADANSEIRSFSVNFSDNQNQLICYSDGTINTFINNEYINHCPVTSP